MKPKTKVIPGKMDSEVEGKFSTDSAVSVHALIAKMQSRQAYDRAEKLAGSKNWIRNFSVQALMKAFPQEPRLWHVSRYFPDAEGCPLYVDEVVSDHTLPASLRKVDVMARAGIRFLILTNNMTEYQDVEALEKCGQPNKKQDLT